MTGIDALKEEIRKLASPQKAKNLQRFFKTGKGQYGEGDVFLGLTVPESRKLAIKYENLPLAQIKKLLKSKMHEERLIALIILVHNFKNGTDQKRNRIYNLYLKSTRYINNWDLVDTSADLIVGQHLIDRDKSILYKLATSKNLWERRIAIIATWAFIKKNQFIETLKIAEILLNDKHDLIHKAIGWMLREVGKKDQKVEEDFLKKYYHKMPRTSLRYAIERFPKKLRTAYLKGQI